MKRSHFIALVLSASLLLMYIAFYNGYPVINSDDSSYLRTAMATTLNTDVNKINGSDRTPFYGWFIRYASLGKSLWYVIFFQSLIVAFLLIKYIYLIQKDIPEINQIAISMMAIISLTCVSWITSYLMPDIFGGMLLLTIILFLFSDKKKIVYTILYIILMYMCVLIHNSHFLILFLFSLILLIQALIKKHQLKLRKSIVLLSIAILGGLTICTENMTEGNGFAFSKSSHIFLMSRLCEMGILKVYLDDQCPYTKTKLCDYKSDLPVYEWDFMWNANSPLYKTGGWDSSKAEYSLIIKYIMFHPKYLSLFIRKSAVGTLRQMGKVNISDHLTPQGSNSEAGYGISHYFPDEVNENIESLQSEEKLSSDKFNIFYVLFLLFSTFWILFYRKLIENEFYIIYLYIVLYFIVNALVTSTFSTVIDRFQNRIFWLFPATNAIFMVKYYYGKYSNKHLGTLAE